MEEGLVSLAHGPLHYRRQNCAQPEAGAALLLHGLLATSFGWRSTLHALARRCNSFALDLPGIAASAPLPDFRAPLSRLAACVAEFWRALRLPPVTLIGSSWGGAVALETTAQWPEMVERLILAAPVSPFFRPTWRQRILLRPPAARCAAALLRRTPLRWYQAGLETMWASPAPLAPDLVAGYWQPLQQPRLGPVLAGFVAEWRADLQRLAPRLSRITAPTLLIWGDRDRVVPPESAAPLCQALSASRLVMLPGAGHLSFEERPEAFNAAVLNFLAASPPL